MHRPRVAQVWWPRFLNIASWFIRAEAARRPELIKILTEINGKMEILPGITLSARADRIELTRDNLARIIDYKTGTPPTAADLKRGERSA